VADRLAPFELDLALEPRAGEQPRYRWQTAAAA
jgi:hypothetical protein